MIMSLHVVDLYLDEFIQKYNELLCHLYKKEFNVSYTKHGYLYSFTITCEHFTITESITTIQLAYSYVPMEHVRLLLSNMLIKLLNKIENT